MLELITAMNGLALVHTGSIRNSVAMDTLLTNVAFNSSNK